MAANEPIPPSPPGVVVVAAPGELWRIATTDNDLRFAEIDPITAAGPGGNRYDVPGGGVLYASSVVRGCFAETLARYRVDIEHEHTRSAMERELPLVLARFDLEHLDVPTVRGADRRLTRALAEWSYTRTDEQGKPLYSGIRYMSKHGDYECWAIFAGTKVELCAAESIEKCDIDLRAVANTFNLTIH